MMNVRDIRIRVKGRWIRWKRRIRRVKIRLRIYGMIL
jgi:hypothetical protein